MIKYNSLKKQFNYEFSFLEKITNLKKQSKETITRNIVPIDRYFSCGIGFHNE